MRDLLGLYYQPNETEAQRSRQIALFVKDLSNFSDDAVGWAIEQWRQNEDRRPTPATLRQLCMRRLNQAERRLKAERRAAALPSPDQPRDPRPAETMERLLTTAGFTRDEKDRYWELRAEDDEEKPKPPHWTEAEMSEKMRRSFEHTLRVARSQNALIRKP